MTIDPFVVFVVILTLVIGVGGLLVDRYGRMSDSRTSTRHPPD